MTKETTQEEEKEAYNRKFLDYCEVFGIDSKKCIQEYYHDIVLNSDEYKKLEAENQRLKEQLKDYENVLKDYADGDFYEADINLLTNPLTNKEEVFSVDIQDKKGNVIYTKAQETLKKWEE